MDARHAGMPASIAESCAGRADIIADMQDVDIAAGTGIAGIGEATFTPISTAFRAATTILTGHAATLAYHAAADGIADACATGDTVTAITEAACVTMVADHAESVRHRQARKDQ
ncbi:MAG: hypothetical protein HKP56_20080 [Anderseniella sp.]|nr:hypothetical protein [Anderseniella sp.]